MWARYRTIFRAPGAAAFCAASFVMRISLAIYPLGIVLIISARDGRYAFAGVLSAFYTFGFAVGSPLLSVLVDRYGQRRLLVPCAAVHGAGVVTLAILFVTGAPNWLLVVPVVVFGFTYLPARSLAQARWAFLFDGRPELATALSMESVVDEVQMIVGPLIATVLATHAEPVLVLYLGVALVIAGSLWLATRRATEPRPHPRDGTRHMSALRTRGLVAIIPATIAMGAFYASAELSIVAFCGQHGHISLSGVVLAAGAVGSIVGGLLYGAVEWRADVLHRFRLQVVAFAALPFVLFAATNVPVLAVATFVLSLGVAPTVITLFALVQRIVPARALTEGLSWVGAGINVGYGAGTALVGGIADHYGARAAFSVVVASSVSVAVFGLSVRVRHDTKLDAPAYAAEAMGRGGPSK